MELDEGQEVPGIHLPQSRRCTPLDQSTPSTPPDQTAPGIPGDQSTPDFPRDTSAPGISPGPTTPGIMPWPNDWSAAKRRRVPRSMRSPSSFLKWLKKKSLLPPGTPRDLPECVKITLPVFSRVGVPLAFYRFEILVPPVVRMREQLEPWLKDAIVHFSRAEVAKMADWDEPAPKRRKRDRTSGRGRQDAMDETSDFVPELCTFDAEGAAKVLNSLNVSSQPSSSPGWQTRDLHGVLPGDGGLSSSAASSGSGSGQSEGGPSPPHNPLLSTPMDDGLDLEENVNAFYNDSNPRQEEEPSQSTMYKCLWKLKAGECGLFFGTEDEVISHIRKCHFNGQEMPDGEEDFYFTDVEMEGVTSSFARMTTASSPPSGSVDFPPGASSLPSAFDHDYQLKQPAVLVASSVPTGSNFLWPGSSRPIPINLPEGQITRSLSWQPSTSPSPQQHPLGVSPLRTSQSSVQERLQQHQALSPKSHMLSSPPKGASSSRKPRSETTAKCRKHFGTDKREMWCTQCKWNKACSRFT